MDARRNQLLWSPSEFIWTTGALFAALSFLFYERIWIINQSEPTNALYHLLDGKTTPTPIHRHYIKHGTLSSGTWSRSMNLFLATNRLGCIISYYKNNMTKSRLTADEMNETEAPVASSMMSMLFYFFIYFYFFFFFFRAWINHRSHFLFYFSCAEISIEWATLS